MGLVIDTSALIYWERNTARLPESFLLSEPLVIPAIVWAEALVGVRLAKDTSRATSRLNRLIALKLRHGVKPFTAEVAEYYADIHADLSRRGSMIPQNDIAVAATARSLSFGVVIGPNDEAHFRQITGLEIHLLAS